MVKNTKKTRLQLLADKKEALADKCSDLASELVSKFNTMKVIQKGYSTESQRLEDHEDLEPTFFGLIDFIKFVGIRLNLYRVGVGSLSDLPEYNDLQKAEFEIAILEDCLSMLKDLEANQKTMRSIEADLESKQPFFWGVELIQADSDSDQSGLVH